MVDVPLPPPPLVMVDVPPPPPRTLAPPSLFLQSRRVLYSHCLKNIASQTQRGN